MTRPLHRRLLPFAVGLVPFALLVLRFNFVCDDAFIAFRYARNLARGFGLRYNLGVQPPVEGFSEFLWTLWMAVFEWLGADVLLWSRLTSVACGVALLGYVSWFLQRRLRLSLVLAALGTLFLATLPPLAVWSTGGLATMPFALAVFATFERLLGDGDRPHGRAAGVLALLASLLRADGAFWAVLVLATGGGTALLRRDRRLLRSTLAAAGILVLGAAMHLTWRYGYFGDLLPNTARAKVAFRALAFERGAYYVISFFLTFPSVALVLLLSPPLAWRQDRGLLLQAWLVCAATLAYIIAVGGDFMCMGRFVVPMLPFVAVLFGLLLRRIGSQTPLAARAGIAVTGVCVALSLLPAFNLHVFSRELRKSFQFRWYRPVFYSEYEQWNVMALRTAVWVQLGRALKMHSPPGATLVSPVVGAVGYYSDLFLYDQCGLTWREIALREVAEGTRKPAGHDKCVRFTYFAKYQPTYLQAQLVRAAEARRLEAQALPRDVPLWYHRRTIPLSPKDGFSPGVALSLLARE